MTSREIADYIANECGSYPYFERYANRSGTAIVVSDEDGNQFEVSVKKCKKGGAR